jgi:hypothetical protein
MLEYIMSIHVRVTDETQLREYAARRAAECGFSAEEVENARKGTIADCISWVFDAGTPEGAGIQIEDSGAEAIS